MESLNKRVYDYLNNQKYETEDFLSNLNHFFYNCYLQTDYYEECLDNIFLRTGIVADGDDSDILCCCSESVYDFLSDLFDDNYDRFYEYFEDNFISCDEKYTKEYIKENFREDEELMEIYDDILNPQSGYSYICFLEYLLRNMNYLIDTEQFKDFCENDDEVIVKYLDLISPYIPNTEKSKENMLYIIKNNKNIEDLTKYIIDFEYDNVVDILNKSLHINPHVALLLKEEHDEIPIYDENKETYEILKESRDFNLI